MIGGQLGLESIFNKTLAAGNEPIHGILAGDTSQGGGDGRWSSSGVIGLSSTIANLQLQLNSTGGFKIAFQQVESSDEFAANRTRAKPIVGRSRL